jgi:hypothetical membrane protein
MSSKFEKITLICAIGVMIIGYNFHYFFWKGFYYQCMASGIFLCFALIKSLCESRKDLKKIANVCFWLSVSNLLDEIFFDPTAIGINEYVFAVIIIIWQWKFRKK